MSQINVDRIVDASGGVLAPISSVMRNRIINGSMVLDQRNAGASVTLPDGAGSYAFVTDRFGCSRADGATATGIQSSTAPAGFTNSLLITNGTGITVAASGQGYITHYIEGYNIADLGFGTANAKTVTLSFWIQSSITGTHSGALNNGAFNRSYPFTYTISASNTWEYKTVTIAGDTTGTWGTTNGRGIVVTFNNGSGSTYLGTAGAWAGSQLYGATGSVALNSVTGSTWFITGVQLEVGTQATSFEYRQFGAELSLCQRYCYVQRANNGDRLGFGWTGTSTVASAVINVPVTMRSAPTLTSCTAIAANDNNAQYNSSSISIGAGVTATSIYLSVTSSGMTIGRGAQFYFITDNGLMILNSEL